jgi:AraC-like DNA-binding protein
MRRPTIGERADGRTIAHVSVYSTPALRVGVYRCPPGDALWHETNDNIGDRPHVVFPGTVVGLVRDGRRVTATPADVVFYRPFETYERSLRDLRLRAAVERIGEQSLSRLAADLGYCTPSHFSDRFRGAFGMPPSQLRNFMEAEAPAGS